jgi:hypothetical protein
MVAGCGNKSRSDANALSMYWMAASMCHDGRAPVLSLFPHLRGFHSLTAGALWVFLSPPEVQRWPCCAPPSMRLEILSGLGLGLAQG